MPKKTVPRARLRRATKAELKAFADALGVDLDKESERLGGSPSSAALVAVLGKAFENLADKGYTAALRSVASHLTTEASWKDVELKNATNVEWLENYVFQLYTALSKPDYKELPPEEKARLRAKAIQALEGDAPSAEDETAWWTEAAGAANAGGLAVTMGWWLLGGIGALAMIALWLSPSMKKLVPATLVLINVRKRIEFEAALRSTEAA